MGEDASSVELPPPRQPERYTDEAFITAVSEQSPTISSEVADIVGCSHALANKRLKVLAAAGHFKHKKTGGVNLWYTETHSTSD